MRDEMPARMQIKGDFVTVGAIGPNAPVEGQEVHSAPRLRNFTCAALKLPPLQRHGIGFIATRPHREIHHRIGVAIHLPDLAGCLRTGFILGQRP